MMFNYKQSKEIELFERRVLNAFPEQFQKFIIRSREFQRRVDYFEELIAPFLTEDGLLDGVAFNNVLANKFPQVIKFISFPNEDFRLVDFVDSIFSFLFGGG